MVDGVGDLIIAFFSGSWRLLTEFTIPGFNFSPAVMFVGIALISFGFKLLSLILGISFGGGESYRSQSRKGKISEDRTGDEK